MCRQTGEQRIAQRRKKKQKHEKKEAFQFQTNNSNRQPTANRQPTTANNSQPSSVRTLSYLPSLSSHHHHHHHPTISLLNSQTQPTVGKLTRTAAEIYNTYPTVTKATQPYYFVGSQLYPYPILIYTIYTTVNIHLTIRSHAAVRGWVAARVSHTYVVEPSQHKWSPKCRIHSMCLFS